MKTISKNFLVINSAIFIQFFLCTPILAEVKGPGWFVDAAERISPEKSRAYYQKLSSKKIKMSRTFAVSEMAKTLSSTSTVTPEIAELARALHYDPQLIYDYVNSNIDYIPYFGLRKGATQTLIDRSGNDFDQASLMIALLRESGHTANFVHGTKVLPNVILAEWLGVKPWLSTNPQAVSDLAAHVWSSGGIPCTSGGILTAEGVWVKATINGVERLFDPSIKHYNDNSRIDIDSAMGYNRADFLNTATTGATVTSDYVQNLNQTGLNNKLKEYTANLISTFRSQYPNSEVRDIIGGRQIAKPSSVNLSLGISVLDEWADIPSSYIATMRVQHQGIDHTFEVPEIIGKRLTITYAGSNFIPELRLDGVLIAAGNSTTYGNMYDLSIFINHPYAAFDGTYADQTCTVKCTSGSTYAIISDFGGTTDNLIRKRHKELGQSMANGLADTSEQVLGESLNIIGLTWMKEHGLICRLLEEIDGAIYIPHHAIGLMRQETGYCIDIQMLMCGLSSKRQVGSYGEFEPYFSVLSIGSAFEHAIFEQLIGSDKPGISTIKSMQIANNQGSRIFWANNGNFASIQTQLHDYSSNILNHIQTEISAGKTLILPDDGNLVLNQWHGVGYAGLEFVNGRLVGFGMWVENRYLGGVGTIPGYIPPVPLYDDIWTILLDISYDLGISTPTSSEPVDMATGAYLCDRTDIALGGKTPMGLEFHRSYNSSRNGNKRSMGYGWQHNYDIFLNRVSDGDPGLGLRTPVDAAAMIANLYIADDLTRNEDNLTGWVVMFLAHKWAVDQLIDNAISVNIGGQMTEYIKLPDGSYSNPPGITTKLIDNGNGTFSLKERFGTEMDFDTNDKIKQLQDIDGNTLSFTYTGDKLTLVEDAVGRRLTLNYTGDNISSVTDLEGRSVSYAYDGNNDLVNYIDVEGKSWAYGYDTGHRMTTLSNPLGITTATNTYDALDRVKTQEVPRDGNTTAVYNFYFSDFRNVEEDPFGKRTVYYLDKKGRTYAIEDGLRNKTINAFDGQNHIVTITNARNNVTAFTYDGNQNLTKITDALNKETHNTYNAQFHLTDTVNPLNYMTHFDYDDEHHLIKTTDAESNTISHMYYTNGQVNTTTDGRGTVTTLAYDTNNHPLTSRTASHPPITYDYDPIGRMRSLTDQEGAITTFNYDNRGFLLTRIDPLGKSNRFIYDDAGRLMSCMDRNNNTVIYTYTPSDKLKTIIYPDTSQVIFNYNLHDKLTSMQDMIGTTSYTYDDVYRLKSITNPYGQTVSYEYDAVGNMTKIIYPDGKSVTYTYDALNRIKTITNWQSQTAVYNYDDAGRLTSLTNFNGTVTTYGYDNANRLISLQNKFLATGQVLSSYSYTLDGNGNRTQVMQEEPLPPVIPTSATDFIYNLSKNRLLSAGLTNFIYNDEGELATKNTTSYSFDYEHRLKNISGSDSTQYFYDGKGNRIKAVRNGVVTKYVYDAAGNLLAETDDNNTVIRYYIYGRGLLAMAKPTGEVYTYHYNGIGSTVAMTDQNKFVVNKYSYTPFGIITGVAENIPQPFKYAGRYGIIHEPNGLYYMRARYYDPSIYRFISEDPSGFNGGLNLYAYCNNNPINYVDPWGLDTYYVDNEFFSSVPTDNPASHSFVATTDRNPSTGKEVVTDTYSWTSENLGSWHHNVIENRVGAQIAINSGIGVDRWGSESLDPYIANQYLNLQNDTGGYWLVINNCKQMAGELLTNAINQRNAYSNK